MQTLFSQKLMTARKEHNLSQEALGELVGISKQAISNLESGVSVPNSTTLINLCKHLNKKIDYFFQTSEPTEVKLEGISFRDKANKAIFNLAPIELDIVSHLDKYLQLENLLNDKREFINPIKNTVISKKTDIEKAIKELRKSWNIKLGDPINNLVYFFEKKGIKVYELISNESFDGLSAWYKNSIPVIVLNARINEITRKRFTALHELAHLLLNVSDNLLDRIEELCDTFAAWFLLPKELLHEELFEITRPTMSDVRDIKEKYGISIQAILIRMSQEKLITSIEYDRLKKEYEFESNFGRYSGTEDPYRYNDLLALCIQGEKLSKDSIKNFTKSKPLNDDLLTFSRSISFQN